MLAKKNLIWHITRDFTNHASSDVHTRWKKKRYFTHKRHNKYSKSFCCFHPRHTQRLMKLEWVLFVDRVGSIDWKRHFFFSVLVSFTYHSLEKMSHFSSPRWQPQHDYPHHFHPPEKPFVAALWLCGIHYSGPFCALWNSNFYLFQIIFPVMKT